MHYLAAALVWLLFMGDAFACIPDFDEPNVPKVATVFGRTTVIPDSDTVVVDIKLMLIGSVPRGPYGRMVYASGTPTDTWGVYEVSTRVCHPSQAELKVHGIWILLGLLALPLGGGLANFMRRRRN